MCCFLNCLLYMVSYLSLTNFLKLSKLLKSFPSLSFYFIYFCIFSIGLKFEECSNSNSISICFLCHSKLFLEICLWSLSMYNTKSSPHSSIVSGKCSVTFWQDFLNPYFLKKYKATFLLLYYAPYTLSILFPFFCCSPWISSSLKPILKNDISFCKMGIHLCMWRE